MTATLTACRCSCHSELKDVFSHACVCSQPVEPRYASYGSFDGDLYVAMARELGPVEFWARREEIAEIAKHSERRQ